MTRLPRIICTILLLGCIAPAWSLGGEATLGAEKDGMLEFARRRALRHYDKTPRKVMALYYTWYGTPEHNGRWAHWEDIDAAHQTIGSSKNYPIRGAYDSLDPAIIRAHVREAKANGVDGFIATWWGRNDTTDRAMPLLLEEAARNDFTISIYLETIGSGDDRIEKAISDLAYVLNQYGSHPAFLKVDGKPVIFAFKRVTQEALLDDWPKIISGVRERYEGDFLFSPDGYFDHLARLFDVVHTYNVARDLIGKQPEAIREYARKTTMEAVQLARRHHRISCLTVIPGFDDRKVRSPSIVADRHDGETYRILWEEAIAAEPDWILITSWNEWHEGSEIEPSIEEGEKYLKMTREFAEEFKRKQYSDSTPRPGGGFSPEQKRELESLYEGKTIGILPGCFGAAAFYLLDAGVDVKVFEEDEVLDPSVFHPSRFPVVLNAGGESYIQTVKEKGDFDRALTRYLEAGGLVISMTSGPLPFFYNEEGEIVASASSRFGLPVHTGWPGSAIRGWTLPPEGETLNFHLDQALPAGLPGTVPYPSSGDLRWRPCNREALEPGDEYLSLAKLRNAEGRDYGDGIAYIEHRVSSPVGAKHLYAWMGMFNTLAPHDLVHAVFQMAAEKSEGKAN